MANCERCIRNCAFRGHEMTTNCDRFQSRHDATVTVNFALSLTYLNGQIEVPEGVDIDSYVRGLPVEKLIEHTSDKGWDLDWWVDEEE